MATRILEYIDFPQRLNQLNSWLAHHHISLPSIGLVVLADLGIVQERTALTGGSGFWDIFVLCPGLHLQQRATELNRTEYPACGALTTGYVFRVENPATVYWLQRIGRPGHLTTCRVRSEGSLPNQTGQRADDPRAASAAQGRVTASRDSADGDPAASAACSIFYGMAVVATIGTLAAFYQIQDTWASIVLSLFILARALNVLVVHRRSRPGWFGQAEPGVSGDLLILLSQDRWVRLQGLVDDLKAVTSGTWMRDSTPLEGFLTGVATLLTYFAGAATVNASRLGQFMLMVHLLLSAGCLAAANASSRGLYMHGRRVEAGACVKYMRRIQMARELIEETGRDDWAVRMGIINQADSKSKANTDGGVTM